MSLEILKLMAKDFYVEDIAATILDNPKFPLWSGSSKPTQHHYGDGGLMQHTYEVVDIALTCNEWFKRLNKNVEPHVLYLSCLFHDYGKIWDYSKTAGVWHGTQHKKEIHHISRSAIEWNRTVDNYKTKYESIRDIVTHAILSHHGLREWGSPVRPNTRLAWILHLADNMSARLDDCDKINYENLLSK